MKDGYYMESCAPLSSIIYTALDRRASDIHIVRGVPVRFRIDGKLVNMDEHRLTPEECENYARAISPNYMDVASIGEQDLAVSLGNQVRCRVNLFRQQGCISAAIRILNDHIPTLAEIGLPTECARFTTYNQGIVLVTGETGSGKSTTIASLLDIINHRDTKHIITLEDPIEYIFDSDKCIVNQREVGTDTRSFSDGLRAILREDPDVILVGEMRELETIETALLAAETGHLVFASLHTNSAADTIDRIVNVFPANQQPQIRLSLSMTLQAVLCQELLPHRSGHGRVLATELMFVTPAVRNLIREGKTPQISNAIATSGAQGSHLMDNSLLELYGKGKISAETVLAVAHDPEAVRRSIRI